MDLTDIAICIVNFVPYHTLSKISYNYIFTPWAPLEDRMSTTVSPEQKALNQRQMRGK